MWKLTKHRMCQRQPYGKPGPKLLVCWALPMGDVAQGRIVPTGGDVLPPVKLYIRNTIRLGDLPLSCAVLATMCVSDI